jgi:hypothetical protein
LRISFGCNASSSAVVMPGRIAWRARHASALAFTLAGEAHQLQLGLAFDDDTLLSQLISTYSFYSTPKASQQIG